jgi:hypothetical protein
MRKNIHEVVDYMFLGLMLLSGAVALILHGYQLGEAHASNIAATPTPVISNVLYVHDDIHKVGCWMPQNGCGISCLPDPGAWDMLKYNELARRRP